MRLKQGDMFEVIDGEGHLWQACLVNKHMINDLTAIGEWSYECKQKILACDGSVKELNIPHQFKLQYKTF